MSKYVSNIESFEKFGKKFGNNFQCCVTLSSFTINKISVSDLYDIVYSVEDDFYSPQFSLTFEFNGEEEDYSGIIEDFYETLENYDEDDILENVNFSIY